MVYFNREVSFTGNYIKAWLVAKTVSREGQLAPFFDSIDCSLMESFTQMP